MPAATGLIPAPLASFCTIPALAAPVSTGILGGAPFTDVVNNPNQLPCTLSSTSSNYTVGPSIQINLPLNLRFECEALFRPHSFGTTSNAPLPSGVLLPSVSANGWDFPMLAQHRFKFLVVLKSRHHSSNGSGLSVSMLSQIGSNTDQY